MTEKPVIFVFGLGRCGTSLTMQILNAAGIPCVGDFPAFETWETNEASITKQWVSDHRGYAAKMLDPHRSCIPQDSDALILWIDRDVDQQAKSQCKMLSMLGGMDVTSQWRQMRSQIKRDRRKCLKIIDKWPVMMLKFEDILTDPLSFSRVLSRYLSPRFNIEENIYSMARVVIRRDPSCMPGLDIESKLISSAA